MDPRIITAIESIAASLKTHFWPQSFGDLVQVALFFATAITIYFLRRYTNETVALRKATRDQVEVNNQVLAETIKLREATQRQVEVGEQVLAETAALTKATITQANAASEMLKEAQKQTEQSNSPMLILSTFHQPDSATKFLVNNAGKGVALNANCTPFVYLGGTQSVFRHRVAIAAGDSELASLHENGSDLNVGDMIRQMNYTNAKKGATVTFTYQNTAGDWYETVQSVLLTQDKQDLDIHFLSFRKRPD